MDGAYVKSHRILPSTSKYLGVVGTLPVKVMQGGPGERQEGGRAAAVRENTPGLWVDSVVVTQLHPPAPQQRDVRGCGRRTGRRGRASAGLPPLPSSLTSSSLFSSCCSEQAAESEQREQEILYVEGEIRVLFLLKQKQFILLCWRFHCRQGGRLGSALPVQPRRLLVFLTPSR